MAIVSNNLIFGLANLCGGFLLAVLWFDLMFDTAALPFAWRGQDVSMQAVDVIAAYYRRAVIASFPMNLLVAVMMLGALACALWRLAFDVETPLWVRAVCVVLVGAAVVVALLKTVPEARRLGQQNDPLPVQATLAVSILKAHIAFFAMMLSFVILQYAG